MPTETVSIRELARYFVRLGSLGFGGPIALAAAMQRDLVETRHWFSEAEYVEGLALAQLAPGPLAAQLAMYLGWARGGALGAAVIGLAFVLPSFLMVLALSVAYVGFGGLPWMRGAFYGIGAAVIAIIAKSVVKLTRSTLGRDRLLWVISAASALATVWTESEVMWLFIASGVVMLLIRAPWTRQPASTALGALPLWSITGLSGPCDNATLWNIVTYFTQAGAVVFGSGLAIVPFLHGGVVIQYHWLTERQFLDAVAVAMITPGPVVITVAFIGYLVAGVAGAVLAALGTFVPCYLFTIIPAPHFSRLSKNRSLKAFVDGVTAAAIGALGGAVVVLGGRALIDAPTLLIAVVTLAILQFVPKAPEPLIIVAAGIAGVLIS